MINEILKILEETYPEAKCGLEFGNNINLLVAVILSAQCKDERVNQVMRQLSQRYTTAADYANADLSEFEQEIYSIGLYKNKARHIVAACSIIENEYGGELPCDMDKLLRLPGVGRKVANCILSEAFRVPSIVVDTHVLRISRRLGLTQSDNPEKVERELAAIVPTQQQINFCHRIITHGRRICLARSPKCQQCPLKHICKHNEV